jgi:two-component system cell cycle response regulator
MDVLALECLAALSSRLLAEPGLQASLQHVADAALELLGGDHASVRLCGRDGLMQVGARAGVGSSAPPPPFRRGEGVLGWVAETGRIARIDDSRSEPRFRDHPERGFPVGSLLSVPVAGPEGTLGVLSVSSPAQAAFDRRKEAIATMLACAAAQALHTAELRQLTLTDSHTLAYNRRYLQPRLQEEMERAQRGGEPLSLLLLDLDHFKRVNDQHGHGVGDAVLAAFADTVRRCVRAVDVLVRRGGEEFVLIMPSTDTEAALRVAERIRERVGSAPLAVRDGVCLPQTVSIGLAMWNGHESADALEERADLAMYEAKRRGRNRVVTAGAQAEPERVHQVAG